MPVENRTPDPARCRRSPGGRPAWPSRASSPWAAEYAHRSAPCAACSAQRCPARPARRLPPSAALQRSLSKDQLASSKEQRNDLKRLGEDRALFLSKDQKNQLEYEKQVVGVRSAGLRLLAHAGTDNTADTAAIS